WTARRRRGGAAPAGGAGDGVGLSPRRVRLQRRDVLLSADRRRAELARRFGLHVEGVELRALALAALRYGVDDPLRRLLRGGADADRHVELRRRPRLLRVEAHQRAVLLAGCVVELAGRARQDHGARRAVGAG